MWHPVTSFVDSAVSNTLSRQKSSIHPIVLVTNWQLDGFVMVMSPWTRCSDAELLAATRSEPEAFACFYDRYETSILGYFMRRTRNPQLAAELGAEVFAAALGSAGRYRSVGPTAAGWLFKIAQNVLLKSARKGRVEEAARRRAGIALQLQLSRASLERIEGTVSSEAWVSELLDRLPGDQRDAVRAHILDDRPYQEIASKSGTSEAVIRKRVSRGLATLRRDLRRSL
jgi:RNA polymerase sigma-70 factor (ECF subfamily)